jgi:hypothetical protein
MNHFKSKGGSGTGANDDIGDGSGNCWNTRRTKAAEALLAWVDSDGYVLLAVYFFLYDLITLRTLILQLFLSSSSQILWYI